MAISEEEIKLILNTQDSKTQVHALATEVQGLTEQMEVLAKDFNEGRLTEAQYVANSQTVSAALRDRAALTEEVARSTGILEKSHRDLGQTMLQGSYALQDFTSQLGTRGLAGGLAAVQNNIPGILQGLGAGAGLTGVLSVLSVGLGAALPLVEKFFTGIDPERAKEAAEHIKAMADAAKSATTAPRTEVEKQVEAAFQQYKGMGIDVIGKAASAIEGGPGGAIPTGGQQSRAEAYAAIGKAGVLPGTGPLVGEYGGAVAEFMGLALSPEGLKKELNKANVDKARRLVGEATQPGEIGKRARNELRRLARDNPGAFPPDFLDFMQSVEERPEDRMIAEAKIEEEDPDAQQHARRAAGIDRRNQALEDEQAAQKRTDRITATYVDDAKTNEQELHRDKQEKERAGRQAAQATAKAARERAAAERVAKHEADQAARAADPSVMEGREREQLEDRARTMAVGMEGPMGWQPSRTQFNTMISQAVGNMPMGGGQDDLAQAIRQAAWAGYQKSQMDMARQVQRGQVWSEARE